LARQGDLLRRQGVRSRGSQDLSRHVADQEGVVMPAAKLTSIASGVPVPDVSVSARADIVPFRAPVRPALERYGETVRHAANGVRPPLIVIAVSLFLWQLLCSEPGSRLPPPSKVVADAWDFIADPFYDNGGVDKGAFWQLTKSLGRVSIGF